MAGRGGGAVGAALADATMYARFALGLHGYLRRRVSLDEAGAIVRRRLAEREAGFLRMVERAIYGYPRSPYRPLLKLAGCELGDLRRMVRARGLEGTLLTLREAGVYVGFEEFKGRQPIVRGGRVIPVGPRGFDNPVLSHAYQAQSGGTTGAGTRVEIDLDHMADETLIAMLALASHGTLHAPSAVWGGVLPDARPINILLQGARMGNVPRRWFAPIAGGDPKPALKHRLAHRAILGLARRFGVPLPTPEPVRLDQAGLVARWAAETARAEGACLVRVLVSMALRLSIAARELGLDLRGTTFMGGGEPPTPAKVREIAASGARWVPTYGIMEVGLVGVGCARPLDGTDVHFMQEHLALIQFPRRVPGTEISVDAFQYTNLLPSSPKVLLNVESDDYGILEARACGCPLEGYGFGEHIREVRSFRKLTGEGVTLVGGEMIRILEEVLPARFGGSPLDYQLAEEEDARGLTRLSLLISPRVEIADERAVVDTVLEALERSSVAAGLAQAIWRQAGTLRVQRKEPIWTARGKLMPLHLAQRAAQPSEAGHDPRSPAQPGP
jgi:hypothetical protein